MTVNEVRLLGRLGGDPETRYTKGGKEVTTFSLATSVRWRDSEGQTQERVDWHRVVAWEKLSKLVVEYVKKGSRVMVAGRLSNQTYTRDGVEGKLTATQIIARDIIFL